MPVLTWDAPKARRFESGLDRGVLYLSDGTAVPWNGLTSVVEKTQKEATPIYYEGRKIGHLINAGDFSATLSCVTYPEEFSSYDGTSKVRRGMTVGDQPSKSFSISYRTLVGDSVTGPGSHYKLHVIYNLIAVPSNRSHTSESNSPSYTEFEWDVSAIPEEIPHFRPSAHLVFDTRELDPWLVEEIEKMLYGSFETFAGLMPIAELVEYAYNWARVRVIDNGDGTWTCVTAKDGFIELIGDDGEFRIKDVNAVYLDETTFKFMSTVDYGYDTLITILDNGDGTWVAYTEHDNLLITDELEGTFTIRNANVETEGGDKYRLSDTLKN